MHAQHYNHKSKFIYFIPGRDLPLHSASSVVFVSPLHPAADIWSVDMVHVSAEKVGLMIHHGCIRLSRTLQKETSLLDWIHTSDALCLLVIAGTVHINKHVHITISVILAKDLQALPS